MMLASKSSLKTVRFSGAVYLQKRHHILTEFTGGEEVDCASAVAAKADSK